ncbi:coiled-coil-helix-coiled-coil-helix domain containing 3a [Lampris incognitus]|uniref:coiled-coil-helix-coiled-coil-helix domain containing 3a n=1 Tax=Lampris incognitus TaxID=2546036 RepID=UPI0024B621BE|nr:coiled-coil-helix-coiled-coil-helix domain containing 3a [Lampris incognitus]
MGTNNSTRRVSFESDENENITVVKGIRLSENVINRMREPVTPLPSRSHANVAPSPPPPAANLAPSPLLDPVTSLPPPSPFVEPIAPPPSAPPATETVATSVPPPMEKVEAPIIIDKVFLSPSPPASAVAAAAFDPVAALPPPPPPALVEMPPVEPVAPSAPIPEPEAVPTSFRVLPPPAPAVDEETLRKKITDELYKDMEQERARAEQELQAWLEKEKAQAMELAQTEAQSRVQDEISRILAVERAVSHETLQQAVARERISADDEKLRAQLYAKQLEARESELKKQDAFYREQVARLEERSAKFYKVTTENYHKAADQVNAKYKRYEVYPVCADLQGQILKCYRENTGKTLHCSNIAAQYLQCVNSTKQMSRNHQSTNPWGVEVTSSPFTYIKGSKTLLLNAFYEHRMANASIRLLGIIWRKEDKLHFHCVLCCNDEEQLVPVKAELTTHNSHYFFPYGTGDFLCQIPHGCQPRYAGLVSEAGSLDNVTFLPVLGQVQRQTGFPLNFTVCLSTMFNNYDNVLQFIQVGLVKVLPWPIDAHIKVSSSWLASLSPGDLHYYGQIPANNDCLYRYMYKSRYLLMHDADEVILPTEDGSWAELLLTLDKKHGENANYYFANNVFPIEEKDSDSRYNLPEWKDVPGVNFLLHVLREPDNSGYITGKLIVNPRSILQYEVHAIQQHNSGGHTVRVRVS